MKAINLGNSKSKVDEELWGVGSCYLFIENRFGDGWTQMVKKGPKSINKLSISLTTYLFWKTRQCSNGNQDISSVATEEVSSVATADIS